MTMTKERAIRVIMRWVGCDEETANMILGGVWPFNGDNYSAQITPDDCVEICRNGYVIHRISSF